MLVNFNVNGQLVKAVAQPTKQAFLYMFDRDTGQPICPIVEKSRHQGRRARRKLSRPSLFPPSRRLTMCRDSQDDLIDFTPELHAEASKS